MFKYNFTYLTCQRSMKSCVFAVNSSLLIIYKIHDQMHYNAKPYCTVKHIATKKL